jgi:hypothetical protein
MPELRKLTPAEVETLERKPTGQRRQIEAQYDALLSDYAVGEYGEALLEGDEKRLTVRNRLRAAATRRGVGLAFKRSGADLLRFQVTQPTASAPAPVSAPVPSVPSPSATAEPPATPSNQATTRRKRASTTSAVDATNAETSPARTRRRSPKRLEQSAPTVVSVPATRAPVSGIDTDDAAALQKRRSRPKKTA